jgi:hypothetical protein
MAAYNASSLDEQRRSVLDYTATDFLKGSWNDTYFMSPNIQDVPFDHLFPSKQFPRDFYDGNWVVPVESIAWIRENYWEGLNTFWANHTGITMEGHQLMDVRTSRNVSSIVQSCLSFHDTS